MAFNKEELSFVNINTQGTTQVYTGHCCLDYITINKTDSGTVAIIDGTTGSTGNVGTMKASIVEATYHYHVVLNKGLRIVTTGTPDLTICYHLV